MYFSNATLLSFPFETFKRRDPDKTRLVCASEIHVSLLVRICANFIDFHRRVGVRRLQKHVLRLVAQFLQHFIVAGTLKNHTLFIYPT